MAKLFYTLEEAAQKLRVDEERIKQMAGNRQIQPFVDGEKLMFKRDQIDALAASAESDVRAALGDTGALPVADAAGDTGAIPLASSGDTGATEPADSGAGGGPAAEPTGAEALAGSGLGSSGLLSALGSGLGSGIGSEGRLAGDEVDPGTGDGTGLVDLAEAPASGGNGQAASQGSGVSVFDAEEVDAADPMAQTMMTEGVEGQGDEMALESVGSGSGLLDLTREADDTSLGAELLDEIYPGAGEAEEVTEATKVETASDSSSVFDGSVTLEAKDASGVALPEAAITEAEPVSGGAPMVSVPFYGEGPYDGAGSGKSSGFMLSATVVLIVGLIVAVFAVADVPSAITTAIAGNQNTLYYCLAGAIVAWLVLGLVGMALGKTLSK